MDDKVNNITSGPIAKTIVSLAIPVVMGMLMEFALTTVNYFWVSRLGPAAQDAVMSSMVVVWTMFASISIVCIGLAAIVARHVGAKDFPQAVYFIKQGFVLAVALGLLFSSVGIIVAPKLLVFLGVRGATLAMAVPYLRILFVCEIMFFISDTAYAVFRASGDTKTPFKVGLLVVGINMGLDPLLIFGLGPVPALGVVGAAIATTISILVGVVTILTTISRRGVGYDLSGFFKIRASLSDMLRIIKISLPITTQQFVFVLVYWFLIRVVHQFGETGAAAMGIGNRMESLSYLTCFGISIAASTMVGQNLGAAKPDRAARCAWGAAGVAVGLTFVISLFFLFMPRPIASIFTNDPRVLAMAVDYLVILGLSQVTMATEIVLEGAFGGAGDTLPPMLVLLPGSLLRIPLAYYLCFDLNWGINGVWWTLTITTTLKASILAVWFRRGKWKGKKV